MSDVAPILYLMTPETDLTCEQIAGLIVDYVTNEMPPLLSKAFDWHLRQCSDCRAFLRTYQETIRTTRTVRYETIPSEMLSRVERLLQGTLAHRPVSMPESACLETGRF